MRAETRLMLAHMARHSDDMRARRLIEDAARPLRALLDDEHTCGLDYHLSDDARLLLEDLECEAVRIGERWDPNADG